MRKIKNGDTVKVVAGSLKGTVSEVTAVFPKESKVTLKEVTIKKHKKPSQLSEGGIIDIDKKIDWSNVVVFDKKTKVEDRVCFVYESGKKVRKLKKSATVLG